MNLVKTGGGETSLYLCTALNHYSHDFVIWSTDPLSLNLFNVTRNSLLGVPCQDAQERRSLVEPLVSEIPSWPE
jgi:hypothetical protein